MPAWTSDPSRAGLYIWLACRRKASYPLRTSPTEVKKQGASRRPVCMRDLLFRLRDGPQIRLVRLEALRIFLPGVLVGNRGGNDDVFARLPVHRRGDRVLCVQLKRIEQTQHFVEVAPGAHRIDEHRLDLLVGADDEHGADRRVVRRRSLSAACVGMDHVVGLRDLKVRIADHRVSYRRSLSLLDILYPGLVVTDGINAEPDDLGVALVELRLELGHVPKLGSAHRREILGMREQDCPFVPDPVMELDLSFGSFRREVRCFVTYAYCHFRPPLS